MRNGPRARQFAVDAFFPFAEDSMVWRHLTSRCLCVEGGADSGERGLPLGAVSAQRGGAEVWIRAKGTYLLARPSLLAPTLSIWALLRPRTHETLALVQLYGWRAALLFRSGVVLLELKSSRIPAPAVVEEVGIHCASSYACSRQVKAQLIDDSSQARTLCCRVPVRSC